MRSRPAISPPTTLRLCARTRSAIRIFSPAFRPDAGQSHRRSVGRPSFLPRLPPTMFTGRYCPSTVVGWLAEVRAGRRLLVSQRPADSKRLAHNFRSFGADQLRGHRPLVRFEFRVVVNRLGLTAVETGHLELADRSIVESHAVLGNRRQV